MNTSSHKKGFTLVEMLLSLSLFTVIAFLGTSAMLVVVASNKTSQSVSSVMSNLNLALEAMSRNIRVGSMYYCGTYSGGYPVSTSLDCAVGSGQSTMTFLAENSTDTYTYAKSGATIHKYLNGVDQGSITAAEITVTKLEFTVQGSQGIFNNPGSRTQPLTLIILDGYVDNGVKGKVPFNIQTTVSQRLTL